MQPGPFLRLASPPAVSSSMLGAGLTSVWKMAAAVRAHERRVSREEAVRRGDRILRETEQGGEGSRERRGMGAEEWASVPAECLVPKQCEVEFKASQIHLKAYSPCA